MIYHTILSVSLIIANHAQCDPDPCPQGTVCASTDPQFCTYPCSTLTDCMFTGLSCNVHGECGYCSSNADCGGGNNICEFMVCKFSCNSAADCGTFLNTECINGFCGDSNSNPSNNCTDNNDCGSGEYCDTDNECTIDLNCATDNDCNNPLGWDTCMSYSDKPNGYCLLPCNNINDCDSSLAMGLECIDGITLTGCTNCNICFQPFPSCTMDADCDVGFFNNTEHARCDTNRGTCYFSCNTEMDCQNEDASLTCYDNTVVGYKQCVYGTGTFSPTMQTDMPTIASLAPSENPTGLSLPPTKKPSVSPTILTLSPSDYPTAITPVPTQITDVPTNDPTELVTTELVIPPVGSTKQYGIFVVVMVVMVMVSWM